MREDIFKKEDQYNQKYSLEDFIAYCDLLDNSSSKESTEVIFNDSFIHAEMVLTYILDYAKRQHVKEVNMYCGSFSLFRDSASNTVAELREKIKPSDNEEDKMKKWQEFEPYNNLLAKFEEFMESEGQMNVIFEDDISGITSEQVWRRIGKYANSGKLRFNKLDMPLCLNHFVVAGKSYRQENDDVDKTAICCFNDDITCQSLKQKYKVLELMSEVYNF